MGFQKSRFFKRVIPIFLALAMVVSGPGISSMQVYAVEQEIILEEAAEDLSQEDIVVTLDTEEEIDEDSVDSENTISSDEYIEDNDISSEYPESEEESEVITEENKLDSYNAVIVDNEELVREYKIYPIPQKNIVYKDGGFVLPYNYNVVLANDIDQATVNRLQEVLDIKGRKMSKSSEASSTLNDIIIGIYNSTDYASSYVQHSGYTIDESIFEKDGAYFMASDNGDILILAKDTDAAFYALTSLKHIFNQMEGLTIRNFTMEDYADMPIRGFIEGYYGIPWSNEDRMSLMKFGGDFKMTSYMFAPKNDPYHKGAQWRTLYPDTELEKIREMVEVGNASKCKFVWTVHPFDGQFKNDPSEEDMNNLITKFEQLYSVGVRQFGVLGDDVGNLPRVKVIELMTKISDWAKLKGDVYDTVFCPAGYNHSWQGDYSELSEYDKGFPDDIQIFWTGQAVCQPIAQNTLNNFRTHNHNAETAGKAKRRAPLFWLNWPVNDINHSRMLMGSGGGQSTNGKNIAAVLQTDVNPDDIAGAVTNPMQEAEASKVAIYAVADYAWNVSGYSAEESWASSFPYVEPDASDALYTLAKHMSNPQPNNHGLVRPESVELAPKLSEYTTAFNAEANDNIKTKGRVVVQEMNTIIQACDDFNVLSNNENLKDELAPFIASLRDLCQSVIYYIEAKNNLIDGKGPAAFDYYSKGTASLEASRKHGKPTLGGTPEMVDPGSTEIIPFAENLQNKLSKPVTGYIFDDREGIELTASSSFGNSWYNGNGPETKIVDGNMGTYVWSNRNGNSTDYFQIDFNKPATVYGLTTYNGNGSNDDTFKTAKYQYRLSTDDVNTWHDVENGATTSEYQKEFSVSNIELENVIAVRYSSTSQSAKWIAMREFAIAFEPGSSEPEFTSTVIIPGENAWKASDTEKQKMIDGDESTSVHFNVRQGFSENTNSAIVGDFVGVTLSQPITLGKIRVVQGLNDSHGDIFTKYDLQYLDGNEWKTVEGYGDRTDRIFEADLSDKDIIATGVRLYNKQNTSKWYGIREFSVASKVFFNAKAYTNSVAHKNHEGNVRDNYAELAPTADNNVITLKKDEYFGIQLKRVHQLKSVNIDLTGDSLQTLKRQVSENGFEWIDINGNLAANTNARYIRVINTGESDVTFGVTTFRVDTEEYTEETILKGNGDFTWDSVEHPEYLFDKDRTTETIFKNNANANRKFIVDLGREIEFRTFKVVSKDSAIDYPRHGKFSISADKQTWTEILTIGNLTELNPGENNGTENINDVLPDHEISCNTKSNNNIGGIKARYLMYEVTRNYATNKWLRFTELEINEGEYVPSVNDPTFGGDAKDTENGRFEYLTDRDLKTSFIPAEANSNFIYKVSDGEGINKIKIIQASDSISNAKVEARFYKADGDSENNNWVDLGTLSQIVNEFVACKENATLVEIKISWTNIIPKLAELMLVEDSSITAETQADKTQLQQLVNESVDSSSWTAENKAAYDEAIAAARKVIESSSVTQAVVDNAKKTIESAKEKAQDANNAKANMELLNAAKSSATSLNASDYTVASWKRYSLALSSLDAAIAKGDNLTNTEADAVLELFNNAKNALVPKKAEESETDKNESDLELLTHLINLIPGEQYLWNPDTREDYIQKLTNAETMYTRLMHSNPDLLFGLSNAKKYEAAVSAYEKFKLGTGNEETIDIIRELIETLKLMVKAGISSDNIAEIKDNISLIETYVNNPDLLALLESDGTIEGLDYVKLVADAFEKIEAMPDTFDSSSAEFVSAYNAASEAYDKLRGLTFLISNNDKFKRARKYMNGLSRPVEFEPVVDNAEVEEELDYGKEVEYRYSTDYVYTGQPITPVVEIWDNGRKLTAGVDYTVSYKNNKEAWVDKNDESGRFSEFTGTYDAKKRPTIIITGKGSYTKNQNIYFNILPQDIERLVPERSRVLIQSGSKTPVPVIYNNGAKLKSGKDFIAESNGQTHTIKGNGNYTGTVEYKVVSKENLTEVSKLKIAIDAKGLVYAGKAIDLLEEGKLTIKNGSVPLDKDAIEANFDISYVGNNRAGKATVVITAKEGNTTYVGSVSKTFAIAGTDLKSLVGSITLNETYQGAGYPTTLRSLSEENKATLETALKVSYADKGEIKLTEGRSGHYVASYKNNAKVGKATVTLTGTGKDGITGKATININITGPAADKVYASIEEEVAYAKGGAKPETAVIYTNEAGEEIELVNGVDYSVAYNKDKLKATGQAVAEISYKGNYKSLPKETIGYKIVAQSVEKLHITGADLEEGKEVKSALKVTVTDVDGKVLKANTDYKLSYKTDGSDYGAFRKFTPEKSQEGSYLIKVEGIGCYNEEVEYKLHIGEAGKSISKAKTTIPKKNYTGEEIMLTEEEAKELLAKSGIQYVGKVEGENAVAGIEEGNKSKDGYYIVGYINNVRKGSMTVIVRGTGKYYGCKNIKVSISARDMQDMKQNPWGLLK